MPCQSVHECTPLQVFYYLRFCFLFFCSVSLGDHRAVRDIIDFLLSLLLTGELDLSAPLISSGPLHQRASENLEKCILIMWSVSSSYLLEHDQTQKILVTYLIPSCVLAEYYKLSLSNFMLQIVQDIDQGWPTRQA